MNTKVGVERWCPLYLAAKKKRIANGFVCVKRETDVDSKTSYVQLSDAQQKKPFKFMKTRTTSQNNDYSAHVSFQSAMRMNHCMEG